MRAHPQLVDFSLHSVHDGQYVTYVSPRPPFRRRVAHIGMTFGQVTTHRLPRPENNRIV